VIPKTLHIIWVGDDSRRPDNCIRTWIERNPQWTVKIWGNDDLAETDWVNTLHMREMSRRELNGVADMMRWEILYRHGGFVVDADSVCIRPLDDWLLECEAFACWENELARPGLIAAGYFACEAENPFVGQIILDIQAEPTVVNDMAWKTVGPQRLTDAYRRYAYAGLSVLPSHLFIPEHFTGTRYVGSGPVYARQEWASTRRSYDTLHTKTFGADGKAAKAKTVAAPAVRVEEQMAQAAMVARAPRSPGSTAPRSVAASLSTPSPVAAAPAVERSPLESQHAPYFVQKVRVSRELVGTHRVEAFAKLCAGRRVLHMGCADWPITDPNTSLHVALEKHCALLDGFDVHAEALDGLAPHVKGRLYTKLTDVTAAYDLILVPEVMEHVADVEGFLAQIDAIDAPAVVITVPDAYQCRARHFDYVESTETFVEVVHPDHNCWYTPYTLTNVIAKYTNWTVEGVWFFNNMSLLAVATKPGRVVD
jgi:mannosyltransferase OCH1-like enzyme